MSGSTKKTFYLFVLILFVSLYLAFGLIPNKIDVITFKTLNNSINQKNWWSYLWSLMNHKSERWINVFVMVSTQILLLILSNLNKTTVAIKFLLFWMYLQLLIYLQHIIFHNLLNFERLSPSIIFNSYKLSQIYNNSDIKDSSLSSFPGGHALVFTSWLLFTNHILLYRFKYLITAIATPFIIARLFSGAHWLSDVAFSISLAYILYYIIISFVYKLTNNRLLRINTCNDCVF